MYNVLMFKGLYRFGENFMKIAAVIFTALIFFTTLFFSTANSELTSHLFAIEKDNLLYTAMGFVVIVGVGILLWLLLKRNIGRKIDIIAGIVVAWTLLAGLYMAFFGRSMPNSDSWVVYEMSKQMAAGDLSIIHPTESYMSYYPQQIGICTFLSWMIRFIDLFHVEVEEFHFIMAAYAVFEAITVALMYKTVDFIWKNHFIDFVFLYLSIFNLPYIMYSSYLYGEIPALMFFALGALGLAGLFNGKGRPLFDIFAAVIGFTLSVWIRKNSLILIIGVLIALLWETFKTQKWKFLITGIAIGLCAFSVLPMTVKYYEKKANSTLSTGVTASSYFAMGMQDVSDTTLVNPGWYTGYNINTFEASGCNPDLADEISKTEIKNRLDYFKNNPKEAWSFYKSKFMTQWTDGTYFSRESTHVYYGDRSGFLLSVYYGDYSRYYVLICNIFQVIVFFGAFLWAIEAIIGKTSSPLWKSFIFIGVFGGFLFHMLWEANSRYILTYAWLLIPYAAAGFGTIGGIKKKS